ncbi:hypothetical protein [Micromonospora sp. WMMD998]|uniref:hypothetical protein n=1 Tax=Micromonospora sp. WMMD998 TaxID=3016092 RepID=UPI00249B669C|nr:hypothetical protein [Micromonospora sp. WMMD998]WFE37923.1 hypothetical protein O7619_05550 [Micromonospora sp. WMMD998]
MSDSMARAVIASITFSSIAFFAFVIIIAVVGSFREQSRERLLAEQYRSVHAQVLNAVEQLQPDTPPPALEEEIAEVSATLSDTVGRLRDISAKAQAFETEVRDLVRRADAAQATAQLNEAQASKIAMLLTTRSEEKLKEEIERLTVAHEKQIEGLKRSNSKSTWLTFTLGAVLGFLLNLLSSFLVG